MWTHPKVTDYISVCWDLGPVCPECVCVCPDCVCVFVQCDAKFPSLAHLNVFLIICPQQAIMRERQRHADMFDCLVKFKWIPEDSVWFTVSVKPSGSNLTVQSGNFQTGAVRASQRCSIVNTLQQPLGVGPAPTRHALLLYLGPLQNCIFWPLLIFCTMTLHIWTVSRVGSETSKNKTKPLRNLTADDEAGCIKLLSGELSLFSVHV